MQKPVHAASDNVPAAADKKIDPGKTKPVKPSQIDPPGDDDFADF